MTNPHDPITTIIVFCGLAVVYFIPALTARGRQHCNYTSILLTNFFFGWTFIGWCIALIWAFSDNVKEDEPVTVATMNPVNLRF